MVTKGEIQAIDYGGNTCEVRIPYFESAGINDRIIATATIGNQPGMYNGYRAGDVVWIAFEDGEASKPVVIGKLFLGSEAERGDARGVINVESATASSSMTMPINANLAYEKDAAVAQNGETKYGKISDMANKLASMTAQQDKTSYDMAGVVSTGSMLKSEMASVKAGSGNKSTYKSDTQPEETIFQPQTDLSSFSETNSYVGYYLLTGKDKDGKPQYKLVTDANKDSLEIYPGITTPYKLRKLSDGDIWIYTGPNLYEEDKNEIEYLETNGANLSTVKDYVGYYIDYNSKKTLVTDDNKDGLDIIVQKREGQSDKTKAYYKDFVGKYIYSADGKSATETSAASPASQNPCPDCIRESIVKAADDHSFILIGATNCDPKTGNGITETTTAYKLHLAKNQSFYWDGDKSQWVKGQDDRFDEYRSAITQTAEKLQSEFSHTNEKMESYNSSITQTAENITLAVSKTVQGQNKTYAQATKPKDYIEVDKNVVAAFTTLSDCYEYYYKAEIKDDDGNVTSTEWTKIDSSTTLTLSEIKKKTLYTTPNANDVWIYTGGDLYGPVNEDEGTDGGFDPKTKTKKSQYVGKYICLKTDGKEVYAIDEAQTATCPKCDDNDFYAKTNDYYFKLVTADNYDSLPIAPGTTPGIDLHLASNTTFYWNGSEWVEGTPSTLKAMNSTITQTANAIDAKVSKTYNDGGKKCFGWNISQQEDMSSELKKDTGYHVGDSDGKFVVYSDVTKPGKTEAEQTDVLHVNKNGLWVNGNLEVEDGSGQKIFRALPYGDYEEDKDADTITYKTAPQVQIGSKTNVGKEGSVWMSPTTETNEVSIAKSYERTDWGLSCGDSFGVTRDGAVYSTDLVVDGLDFMALTDVNQNKTIYTTIALYWNSSTFCFTAEASKTLTKLQDITVSIKSDHKEVIQQKIIIKDGASSATGLPLYGLAVSCDSDNRVTDENVSWTPRQINNVTGSFTNTAGFFNDKHYSHTWGDKFCLTNHLNTDASDNIVYQHAETDKYTQWKKYAGLTTPVSLGTVTVAGMLANSQYTLSENSSWEKDQYLILQISRRVLVTITSSYRIYQSFSSGSISSGTYTLDELDAALADSAILLESNASDYSKYRAEVIEDEDEANRYIFSGDRCVLYVPRTEVNTIKSISITPYMPSLAMNFNSTSYFFPPTLTVTNISQTDDYNEVEIQATINGVAVQSGTDSSGEETKERTIRIVNSLDTTDLYANVLCYGTDSYYTDEDILYVAIGKNEVSNQKVDTISQQTISEIETLQMKVKQDSNQTAAGCDIQFLLKTDGTDTYTTISINSTNIEDSYIKLSK